MAIHITARRSVKADTLDHVMVGRSNARTTAMIHDSMKRWAKASIKVQLNLAYAAGQIKRDTIPGRYGPTHVYWKEPLDGQGVALVCPGPGDPSDGCQPVKADVSEVVDFDAP